MKKQLPLLVFLAVIILSLAGPGLLYGQKTDANAIPVYSINELLAEKVSASGDVGGTSANLLSQLAFESNPTLVISNGNFSQWGGDVPLVAAVDGASVDYLFKDHQGFDSVQLIRIILEKPEQLEATLKLDQLGYFKNLRYIFYVASFDLCSDSPVTIPCETAAVRKMLSGSTEQNGLIVVYQVVHHQ